MSTAHTRVWYAISGMPSESAVTVDSVEELSCHELTRECGCDHTTSLTVQPIHRQLVTDSAWESVTHLLLQGRKYAGEDEPFDALRARRQSAAPLTVATVPCYTKRPISPWNREQLNDGTAGRAVRPMRLAQNRAGALGRGPLWLR